MAITRRVVKSISFDKHFHMFSGCGEYLHSAQALTTRHSGSDHKRQTEGKQLSLLGNQSTQRQVPVSFFIFLPLHFFLKWMGLKVESFCSRTKSFLNFTFGIILFHL